MLTFTNLKHMCFEIGKRYYFEFDSISNNCNYAHIFIGCEPKYSPSRIMQIIEDFEKSLIFTNQITYSL